MHTIKEGTLNAVNTVAGIVLRLRAVSANPAVENKRSHLFDAGTMKRKSMYFESV